MMIVSTSKPSVSPTFYELSSEQAATRPAGEYCFLGTNNKPFPSCLFPLFQNESWCTTFQIEMSLIFKTMKVQEKLISIWKAVHQDSFWKTEGKGNSEMAYYLWSFHKAARSPRGYLTYPWVGVCGLAPQTLTLLKTKIDRFFIPCFRHLT